MDKRNVLKQLELGVNNLMMYAKDNGIDNDTVHYMKLAHDRLVVLCNGPKARKKKKKKKQKYYAVRVGRNTGIYNTWEECKEQVHGYPQARYKSFEKFEDAEKFMNEED